MHPQKQRKARARRCEISVAMTTVKGNMAPELMGGTDGWYRCCQGQVHHTPKAPFLTQRPGSNIPWGYSQNGACTWPLGAGTGVRSFLHWGSSARGTPDRLPRFSYHNSTFLQPKAARIGS